MANHLAMEKKIAVVGALCEGASIRGIERMTGVNRNTIMTLNKRIGNGCAEVSDLLLRDLTCERLQLDEVWGYIKKKQASMRPGDDGRAMGDVWTWVAIDADTKLVPCYAVGKRENYDANNFLEDLASRVKNRPQVSTDALNAYREAVDRGFGTNVDYGIILKTFKSSPLPTGRYSPPELYTAEKFRVWGNPVEEDISTSYIESQNLTMRMHVRRLARLTNAFSKTLDAFKAAIGLHFAYRNFCKKHTTLKTTPAIAAGVLTEPWTVADLIEKVEG
jgi:IS1 family transposase